jgi:hypothetical protein
MAESPAVEPAGVGLLIPLVTQAPLVHLPGRRHWEDTSEQAERLRGGAPGDASCNTTRHIQPQQLV